MDLHLLLSMFLTLCTFLSSFSHPLQTYIVQLHPEAASRAHYGSSLDWHLSVLDSFITMEDDEAHSRLLYSYASAMEGFAVKLSETEVEMLRKSKEVIAVRPDIRFRIQTTYSYRFLGLSPAGGAWIKSGFGQGSIIGVLDTGIWPECPSFDDRGMPPVPLKWKGICQEGQDFDASHCNRKLIGARYFSKGHSVASSTSSPDAVMEYVSPRDSHGHGTHTASTAGGAPVPLASVFRYGAGEARGMAPGSHIAVYKVCWYNGCYSSDILAAMDVAIRDGVDVLSLSLGGFPLPLYEDNIAIGSFRAMEHGITVICAAGNNGPIQNSVANEAPWIATIGASTLDRQFPAVVRLSNGKILYGESMYPLGDLAASERELELVYLAGGNTGSAFCLRGSLPRAQVRGKMVVCDRGINGRAEKGQIVKESGGAAMILANTEINLEEDSVDVHVLPATLIGSAVAQFSSRGPSFTDPSILKPDMIAPGVNIIAAWPQNLGPSALPEDSRRVNFSVMSGTSMACPHVSGLAALIHAAHPNWSPAAIKSALMTTGDISDHQGKPIMDGDKPADLFAIGAGQVNPERAINPGLIYDIRPEDHIAHLCTLGYSRLDVFSITHRNVSCHSILQKNRGFSLNYPSFSIVFKTQETRKVMTRRLTNVGSPNSIYSVELKAPQGVNVKVRPSCLKFKHINQTLSYRVWFVTKKRTENKNSGYSQGYLTWVGRNNSYRIRSPISVTWSSRRK